MATNPAPIIQKINAFDVTQGTVINYSIVGGTTLVRSSKVFIYDNATNELICTHLDTTTLSTHTLPRNTHSSIIYANGKSSADYTNEKQYYMLLQTFTDTSGTAGASGLSSASLFWGLKFPTVMFDAVPTNIDTTSYNFSAVYDTQITTASVSNIMQQYKFDLYNESNVLVQTSGVVLGSGTPVEGQEHQYSISYNFSGLNNDETYYSVVTAVSTEGMTATNFSGSLTVSVDEVSFAKAKVTNNACDGYITIVSNITNIVGKTNVDTDNLDGKIDLTGDGWLVWDEGFTFPTISVPNVGITSRWTMELWGMKFEPSGLTDNESFFIKLEDTGDMFFYIREHMYTDDPDVPETPHIRVDLYIYPYGREYGMSAYLQSNSIPKPDDDTLIDIWCRCIDGWYDLELHQLSTPVGGLMPNSLSLPHENRTGTTAINIIKTGLTYPDEYGWNPNSDWEWTITKDNLGRDVTEASISRTGLTADSFTAIYSPFINKALLPTGIVYKFWLKCDDLEAWDVKNPARIHLIDAQGVSQNYFSPAITNANYYEQVTLEDGVWTEMTLSIPIATLETWSHWEDTVYIGFCFELRRNGSLHFKLPYVSAL